MVAVMFKLFRKPSQQRIDLDNIQAVFFDLDGTLIDIDIELFVTGYLNRLTEQMSEWAEPARATRVLHQAVAAMFANKDPDKSLEVVLHEVLQQELSMDPLDYQGCLERFCRKSLDSLSPLVKGHPLSSQLINISHARGWKVALATNPIFPRVVVDARLSWGNLRSDAFNHVCSYETEHYCKPDPLFFEEQLDRMQVSADACLMIGNDALHDMSASQVGIRTCLLTPWCIKRPGVSFQPDWQGRHEELLTFLAHGTVETSGPD